MSHDPVYGPSKYADKKYAALAAEYPHLHQPFFKRPDVTRRNFFRLTGAGVTCSYLAGRLPAQSPVDTNQGMVTKNTAKNCIFILLTGAISAWDSFDLKVINGSTPAAFNPTSVNGTSWPMGTMPKLGGMLKAAGHPPSQLLMDLLPIVIAGSICALLLAWEVRRAALTAKPA